ncbi:UNVERIFIED_CONTAM: hypothetical protein FKN15_027427 [Acipenser sinensis]
MERQGEKQRFCSVLTTARLLAKFLGFITFLPYQTREPPARGVQEAAIGVRNKSAPVLDVCEVLKQSMLKQRTVLTVPWLVEFLSMVDHTAPYLLHYRRVFTLLLQLYRRTLLGTDREGRFLNQLLIVAVLGWLFQIPTVPEDLFFSGDFSDETDVIETPAHTQGLDCLPLVDQQLLYICCPYLSEFRKLLAAFVAGSAAKNGGLIRKITPTAAEPLESPAPLSQQKLQAELEQAFFHNQPPSLRRTVEFVAERVGSNSVKHIKATLVSELVQSGEAQLRGKLRDEKASVARLFDTVCTQLCERGRQALSRAREATLVSELVQSGEAQLRGKLRDEKASVARLFDTVCTQLCERGRQALSRAREFCSVKSPEAIRILLPEETSAALFGASFSLCKHCGPWSEVNPHWLLGSHRSVLVLQVLSTAEDIAVRLATEKACTWLSANIAALIKRELKAAFDRMMKSLPPPPVGALSEGETPRELPEPTASRLEEKGASCPPGCEHKATLPSDLIIEIKVLSTAEDIAVRLATEKACTWLSANIAAELLAAFDRMMKSLPPPPVGALSEGDTPREPPEPTASGLEEKGASCPPGCEHKATLPSDLIIEIKELLLCVLSGAALVCAERSCSVCAERSCSVCVSGAALVFAERAALVCAERSCPGGEGRFPADPGPSAKTGGDSVLQEVHISSSRADVGPVLRRTGLCVGGSPVHALLDQLLGLWRHVFRTPVPLQLLFTDKHLASVLEAGHTQGSARGSPVHALLDQLLGLWRHVFRTPVPLQLLFTDKHLASVLEAGHTQWEEFLFLVGELQRRGLLGAEEVQSSWKSLSALSWPKVSAPRPGLSPHSTPEPYTVSALRPAHSTPEPNTVNALRPAYSTPEPYTVSALRPAHSTPEPYTVCTETGAQPTLYP